MPRTHFAHYGDNKMAARVVAKALWRLVYFGNHSNVHGLRFVTERNRTWACRLFWMVAVSACGWGLLEILKGTLRSAYNDSLSFTPDTNRLLWNTDFPSVTVCEKYVYHETLKSLNKLFPTFLDEYDFNYKKMFADLCFGENPCQLCNTGCGPSVNCSLNWAEIADKVRKPCKELIHDCRWLDEPLDCCTYFLPLDTEFGTCYTFNSLQSSRPKNMPLFHSNRTTGPGWLSFYIYKDLDVYIHGSEEIPWLKADLDMHFEASDNIDFIFEIVDISNDPLVRGIDLDLRKCRFPDETVLSPFGRSYQVYGYSPCMVICETQLMFDKCHCVHHLRDRIYRDLSCNYTGLGCLAIFAEEKKKMSPERIQNLCKHCLPSCEEIELTRIFYSEYEVDDDDDVDSRVTIRMRNLPNIQYRRNVVRTKMDLVVSIGGLAGLFFGASLLSLVEAIYIIFVRATNN